METKVIDERILKTYNFHINAEKGIYQLAFAVDEDNIESACDCNYKSEKKLCWHRQYVLAGKQQRIPTAEYEQQQELLSLLSKTRGGRELMSTARTTFGEKETCRRCNKSKVIELDKSLYGKILRIFLPSGRKYFCRSCRWSW